MATASGLDSETAILNELVDMDSSNDQPMSPLTNDETELLDSASHEENDWELTLEGFERKNSGLEEPNLAGFISQYDGRELHIHSVILNGMENGESFRMKPQVKDCIIEFMTREDYQELPSNWLLFYVDCESGLQVNPMFRKAVFDCEMAYRSGRLPNLPVLIEDCREVGITGLNVIDEVFFREPEMKRLPQSTEDWEDLAAQSREPKLYSLSIPELYRRIVETDQSKDSINDIISAMIREESTPATPSQTYDPKTNVERSTEEQRARLADIKKGKKLVSKAKDKKGQSKKKPKGSDTTTDSDGSGYQTVVSEIEKRKGRLRKRAEEMIVDSDMVDRVTANVNKEPVTINLNIESPNSESLSKNSLASIATNAALKVQKLKDKLQKEKDDKISKNVPDGEKNMEGSDHEEDKISEDPETSQKSEEPAPVKKVESPKPQKVKTKVPTNEPKDNSVPEGKEVEDGERLTEIWGNANAKFANFVPKAFNECAKGVKKYGCPEPYDKNGESDDEDWIRETTDEPLPSDHYEDWFGMLKKYPDNYYSRDQKRKLIWAYNKWCKDEGNDTCPFTTCLTEKKGKKYSTPRRFLRHLCEGHMHHTVVYECSNRDEQRESATCDGCITPRRGVMIRHYKWCHTPGMRAFRDRMVNLHELIIAELTMEDFRKIGVRTECVCEVFDAHRGKLSARVTLVRCKGKFDMPQELFDDVLDYHGIPRKNVNDPKRQASQSPVRGDAKRSRDASPHSRTEFKKPQEPVRGSRVDSRMDATRCQSPLNRTEGSRSSPSPGSNRSLTPVAWNTSCSSSHDEGMGSDYPDLGETEKRKTTGHSRGPAMSTVPDNRLKATPRPVDHYFYPEQTVACKFAQDAMDKFQEGQKELAVRYHTGVLNLFADSIVDLESSQEELLKVEKEKLKEENEAIIAKEMADVQKEKKQLASANALARKRLKESQDRNEAMNVKFEQVFGVFLDDWNGTREEALELLKSNAD